MTQQSLPGYFCGLRRQRGKHAGDNHKLQRINPAGLAGSQSLTKQELINLIGSLDNNMADISKIEKRVCNRIELGDKLRDELGLPYVAHERIIEVLRKMQKDSDVVFYYDDGQFSHLDN